MERFWPLITWEFGRFFCDSIYSASDPKYEAQPIYWLFTTSDVNRSRVEEDCEMRKKRLLSGRLGLYPLGYASLSLLDTFFLGRISHAEVAESLN